MDIASLNYFLNTLSRLLRHLFMPLEHWNVFRYSSILTPQRYSFSNKHCFYAVRRLNPSFDIILFLFIYSFLTVTFYWYVSCKLLPFGVSIFFFLSNLMLLYPLKSNLFYLWKPALIIYLNNLKTLNLNYKIILYLFHLHLTMLLLISKYKSFLPDFNSYWLLLLTFSDAKIRMFAHTASIFISFFLLNKLFLTYIKALKVTS